MVFRAKILIVFCLILCLVESAEPEGELPGFIEGIEERRRLNLADNFKCMGLGRSMKGDKYDPGPCRKEKVCHWMVQDEKCITEERFQSSKPRTKKYGDQVKKGPQKIPMNVIKLMGQIYLANNMMAIAGGRRLKEEESDLETSTTVGDGNSQTYSEIEDKNLQEKEQEEEVGVTFATIGDERVSENEQGEEKETPSGGSQ